MLVPDVIFPFIVPLVEMIELDIPFNNFSPFILAILLTVDLETSMSILDLVARNPVVGVFA